MWHDHDVEGLVRENQALRLTLEQRSKAIAEREKVLAEREAALMVAKAECDNALALLARARQELDAILLRLAYPQ